MAGYGKEKIYTYKGFGRTKEVGSLEFGVWGWGFVSCIEELFGKSAIVL
jgi:hypothetical protein